MSELSYKELQEQGIFDVPYRAFEYMQSQQSKIDSLNKNIEALHVENDRIQKEYQMMFEGVQGRQKTIDELQAMVRIYEKHVKAIKHIHETQFDENTDTSFILGNLDGFIEYLESDLKGNKDEN